MTLPSADTENPVVRITQPATGTQVTSPVLVEALVADNSGVSAVTLSARSRDGRTLLASQRVTPPSGDDADDDNGEAAEPKGPPPVFVGPTTLSATLDVTGAGGLIFITVTAEDAFGNLGAQTIAVVVQVP
ncbi:MAG: hypothetical protein HY335_02975 [Deinococcus sp.]|nr:hypothetical protein [Deinococcus sp.]